MLKIIEGDILEIKEGIIMHQVNTRGVTGGLAGALRRKYPEAFDHYDRACRIRKRDALGHCCLEVAAIGDPPLIIAHIFGQPQPGPNTDYAAVDTALGKLAYYLEGDSGKDTQIFAPYKIGCGLGGGDWVQYSAIIEKHLPQTIIVRKYG